MIQRLTEIMSTHELRELQGELVRIEKGVWIEILDFDSVTEEVDILKRWEIIDIKRDDIENKEHYTITCKKLDIKTEEEKKKELCQKIISKHHGSLKATFVKCLIDGIESKSTNQLKRILYRLRGEIKDEKLPKTD